MPARVTTTVTTDHAGLERLLHGDVDAYIERLARQVEGVARRNAPRKTGELAKSIHAYRAGSAVWFIAAEAPYSLPVHEGTRPHTIRPKKPGGVLRFPGRGGMVVYTKKANHPGTAPQPFLVDALREVVR